MLERKSISIQYIRMFYPISAYFWGKVGSNMKNGQILKFKEDLKEFKKG